MEVLTKPKRAKKIDDLCWEKEHTIEAPKKPVFPIFMAMVLILSAMWAYREYSITIDDIPQLTPKERKQLQKGLDELQEAEQYVLIAD